MSDLRDKVRSMAERLERMQVEQHYLDVDGDVKPACELIATGDAEPYSIFDYLFDQNVGVHYIVDDKLRYCGVEVTTTSGGPGIWIDTRGHCVRGTWGGKDDAWGLSEAVVDAINCGFEREYDCMRREC